MIGWLTVASAVGGFVLLVTGHGSLGTPLWFGALVFAVLAVVVPPTQAYVQQTSSVPSSAADPATEVSVEEETSTARANECEGEIDSDKEVAEDATLQRRAS